MRHKRSKPTGGRSAYLGYDSRRSLPSELGAACLLASVTASDPAARRQSASGLGRNWKWKASGTVPFAAFF